MNERPDHLEWESCNCGYDTCKDLHISNLGAFVQGSGFRGQEVTWLTQAWEHETERLRLTKLRSRHGLQSKGGPIQRDVLRVMTDGKTRTAAQLSAAIDAHHGRRHSVASINAAVSGMITMADRHWLREEDSVGFERAFSITDKGRAVESDNIYAETVRHEQD